MCFALLGVLLICCYCFFFTSCVCQMGNKPGVPDRDQTAVVFIPQHYQHRRYQLTMLTDLRLQLMAKRNYRLPLMISCCCQVCYRHGVYQSRIRVANTRIVAINLVRRRSSLFLVLLPLALLNSLFAVQTCLRLSDASTMCIPHARVTQHYLVNPPTWCPFCPGCCFSNTCCVVDLWMVSMVAECSFFGSLFPCHLFGYYFNGLVSERVGRSTASDAGFDSHSRVLS